MDVCFHITADLLVTGTVLANEAIDVLDVEGLGLLGAVVLNLLPLAEELLLLQATRSQRQQQLHKPNNDDK